MSGLQNVMSGHVCTSHRLVKSTFGFGLVSSCCRQICSVTKSRKALIFPYFACKWEGLNSNEITVDKTFSSLDYMSTTFDLRSLSFKKFLNSSRSLFNAVLSFSANIFPVCHDVISICIYLYSRTVRCTMFSERFILVLYLFCLHDRNLTYIR